MARILAISSFLAHGRVGLGATVPVLQALGHEVLQLPTVMLSNHPAHPFSTRYAIAPQVLSDMLGALEANGWLAATDAILTGYLPTRGHAIFARDAISRVRAMNPRAIVVCDPILGDDPNGLYIDADAAAAVRDLLVSAADVITPNRFELHWLTGMDIGDELSAAVAARRLHCPSTIATSIPAGSAPDGSRMLADVLITRDTLDRHAAPEQPGIPHGTGDVFAALLVSALLLPDARLSSAAARSHKALQRIISSSRGKEHLDLSPLTAQARVP